MFCKTLPCFPRPGQGEAGLAAVHWDIQYWHFLPPATSTWEEKGLSGVGMWPAASHQEVMLWFYNLWPCVRKSVAFWKPRQRSCYHLPWFVFAKKLACCYIDMYSFIIYIFDINVPNLIYTQIRIAECTHMSRLMYIRVYQNWYLQTSAFEYSVFSKCKQIFFWF